MLEELEILKAVNGRYTCGNTFTRVLESSESKNPHKLQTILLSHVIKSKYSTLRQVFGITQLEPFIHLANVYYWSSLDAEKLIHTTRSHLYQKFQEIYSKISRWDFESKLDELVNNGALHYENEYLVGDKDQFDAMLELKHKVVLNP